MDKITLMTFIGTQVAIIGFVYMFLRNFKIEVKFHLDKMSIRMDCIRKEMREENTKKDDQIMQINTRMDGVYNILLKRTENLKG